MGMQRTLRRRAGVERDPGAPLSRWHDVTAPTAVPVGELARGFVKVSTPGWGGEWWLQAAEMSVSHSQWPKKRLGRLTNAGFARVALEQRVTRFWEVKLGRKAVGTVGADVLQKWGGRRVGATPKA